MSRPTIDPGSYPRWMGVWDGWGMDDTYDGTKATTRRRAWTRSRHARASVPFLCLPLLWGTPTPRHRSIQFNRLSRGRSPRFPSRRPAHCIGGPHGHNQRAGRKKSSRSLFACCVVSRGACFNFVRRTKSGGLPAPFVSFRAQATAPLKGAINSAFSLVPRCMCVLVDRRAPGP